MADTLKKANAMLIEYGNKCCACGAVLVFGGHWSWHREGFRCGPFCNDCTNKPSIERPVDDPSLNA